MKKGEIEIRMKSVMAGPTGTFNPGDKLTVPASQANELIKGGYAEATDPAASAPRTAQSRKLSDDEAKAKKEALDKLMAELADLKTELEAAQGEEAKAAVREKIEAKQAEIDAVTA